MEELYGVKVDYEEAKMLADCASIYQDLTRAENTMNRFIELLKINSNNSIILDCLWTSACVSYARAFSTGRRINCLDASIFEKLQGDAKGVHDYIMNQRNKHIAHSVNPFEQMSVDLQLSAPSSGRKDVVGISVLSMRLAYVDIHGAENVCKLISVLRSEVAIKCRELQTIALEAGKRIPLDELYKGERSTLIAPNPEDARIPR